MLSGSFRRSLFLTAVALCAGAAAAFGEQEGAVLPFRDRSLPIERRIDDLMGRMTLEEKIAIVHGNGVFRSGGVPRLGVPYLWTDDGPQGIREDVSTTSWAPLHRTDDFATALPPGATLAATWNPELAELCGRVIGEEACARGKNVLLGPGINIARTPVCGRNYDYYGEDPWLTSRIAVGYIRGMQSQQTVACVKHYAANNQEVDRGTIDVQMDERTLREIYLPAFEASVREAHAMAIMAAYNLFRGEHCAASGYLLDEVLKKEWGFTGGVISDWGAVHETRASVMTGMDLEMGTGRKFDDFYLAQPFLAGIKAGTYPVARLDDKVRRDLRMLFFSGAMDGRQPGSLNTPAHLAAAQKIAREAIVLLKNDADLLPLDPARIKTLAVIGQNAVRTFAAGGNSAGVKAFRETTAVAGILARAGGHMNVIYSEGYRQPSVRRAGGTDVAGVRRTELVEMTAAEQEELAQRAIAAAKSADAVVFVGGLFHQAGYDDEGTDRADLALPAHQAGLIARIAAANPRTAVVLIDGGPVQMDTWLPQVPSVVQAWYGGSEAGTALAAVLFGDESPSGKLPITFPRTLADTPTAHGGPRAYPGVDGVVHYDEGLLVGYRWYDAKSIAPLFPFGFGLSYTRFSYEALSIDQDGQGGARVRCHVTNRGGRAGAEVVQLYLHERNAAVTRPEKELKAFAKVMLAPGESREVTLTLTPRSFAYYAADAKRWHADAATFDVLVGSSSRDIRLRGNLALAAPLDL